MIGAMLSLLLVGLMRFGMGLLNIQGQVQSIAIGGLLIASILIPNVARQLSMRGSFLNRRILLLCSAGLAVAFLFGAFFFWSRSLVLAP
jgi:rhamnose transport system permease protein